MTTALPPYTTLLKPNGLANPLVCRVNDALVKYFLTQNGEVSAFLALRKRQRKKESLTQKVSYRRHPSAFSRSPPVGAPLETQYLGKEYLRKTYSLEQRYGVQ